MGRSSERDSSSDGGGDLDTLGWRLSGQYGLNHARDTCTSGYLMLIHTSIKQARDQLGGRQVVFNESAGGESEDPFGMNAAGFEFGRWTPVDSHLREAGRTLQVLPRQRSLLSLSTTVIFSLG